MRVYKIFLMSNIEILNAIKNDELGGVKKYILEYIIGLTES